ncbi:hypothetical protein CsSME_00045077 [Camellia sinensis var. sinensis]
MVKAILFNLASKVLDKLFFSIGGRDIFNMLTFFKENASLHCTPVCCGMVRSYLVKLGVKLPGGQKP